MASRSADLQNNSDNVSAEERLFGRPYAYYKPKKSGVSSKLVIASIVVVIVAAFDFLLATNILIYIRTIEPGSTKDAVRHTAVILMSLALIWVSYRFLVWYIKKFKIKDSIQQNKFYQRIANEVIELENLLDNPEVNDKRND